MGLTSIRLILTVSKNGLIHNFVDSSVAVFECKVDLMIPYWEPVSFWFVARSYDGAVMLMVCMDFVPAAERHLSA